MTALGSGQVLFGHGSECRAVTGPESRGFALSLNECFGIQGLVMTVSKEKWTISSGGKVVASRQQVSFLLP